MRYVPNQPLYGLAIVAALAGCGKDMQQTNVSVNNSGLERTVLAEHVNNAGLKGSLELDLSTPVIALATFERAIMEKDVEKALACVYRPEFFEQGYNNDDREKKMKEVKHNLFEDWINSAKQLEFIEKNFGSYGTFVRVIENTGQAAFNEPLRYDQNKASSEKFGRKTSRVKITHNTRTGTLRTDMINVSDKWYVGAW